MKGRLVFAAALLAAAPLPKTAADEAKAISAYVPLAVEGYRVEARPENIAPTPATSGASKPAVFGVPRLSQGHPSTLWDRDDIDQYRKAIRDNPEAQASFARLKAAVDDRMRQPLGVPVPRQGPDGSWLYPGDFLPGTKPPASKTGTVNEGNAKAIADLGAMYALTGEPSYGERCRQMLLAYADGYAHYGHPPGWTVKSYRSATDGRLTGQFLEDGFWLLSAAFGCDLIHDLPSFTDAERNHVRDDLFRPVAEEFFLYADRHQDYVSQTHNRSALCTAAVLVAGYAVDDEGMVDTALYGVGGTVENPTGGLLQVHFGPQSIYADGLWNEGAPGYQVGIASCGLFADAETMWHHGLDLYGYRDGILKRFLDSSLALAYPDARMTVAALHDSGRMALLDDRDWFSNEAGVPYECGYRRYRDPRYLPIVRNAAKSLSMTIHSGPPSLFLDLPAAADAPPRPVENANFYSVGYGVLRLATPDGPNQLILEYGPEAGHSHPSKLGIDLYVAGDALLPFPGVIFPYQDPLDPKWYWTTLANCALTVDEKSQVYGATRWKYPKDLPDPKAEQLVYGPASTVGLERAWSDTVYPGGASGPGAIQDRALFLTAGYLADLFGAFADVPHQYDLAWHFRGRFASDLKLEPTAFPEPVANGYNALSDLRHATSSQPWTATITLAGGRTARFLAAGGTETEVIVGNGHFFTKSSREDEQPPTILERRKDQASALYGNAVDFVGDEKNRLRSVAQEGGLAAGYGLLKIETARGTDLCFAAYRPGSHRAGDLETDALQAFVRTEGGSVRALYLGGGSRLASFGCAVGRSEPGLASVEALPDGSYLVANPSPGDAVVTVTLPALAAMKAFALDDQGRPGAPVLPGKGTAGDSVALSLNLKGGAKVAFVPAVP